MVAPAIIVVLASHPLSNALVIAEEFLCLVPSRGADATWVGLDNFIWSSPRTGSGTQWATSPFSSYSGSGSKWFRHRARSCALRGVSNPRLRIVLLTILLLPMMMPPIVVGDLWKFILHAAGRGVELPAGPRGDCATQNWIGADLGMISITMTDIWQWTAPRS